MQMVVFRLYSQRYKEDGRKLAEMLQNQGISICFGLCEEIPLSPDKLLVVTDCDKDAEYADQNNMALLFCEAPGASAFIKGADMIVQGLEELDVEFLQRIYRRHHKLPWIIAETEHLIIRESVEEDLEDFRKLYRGEGMLDYLENPGFDKEDALERLRQYIEHMYRFYGYGIWSVLEKESDRIVGMAGLENREYRGETVLELGYMIGKPFQRKGYGEEAARAAESYAIEEGLAKELYAFIMPQNQPSIRLIEKMNYERLSEPTKGGLTVWKKKLGRNG